MMKQANDENAHPNPDELFKTLIRKMRSYHPASNFDMIYEAYRIAGESHGTQLRKSGEPYIIHPLSVAIILADLELDRETIAAGLLHDIIEDTKFTYQNTVEMFGEEIAILVDGVTKLDRIEIEQELQKKKLQDEERKRAGHPGLWEVEGKASKKSDNYKEEMQAENYRKMFLAMAKDIRVVVIKIADRLHNMRTLKYMSSEKQKEKAQETLDIYAPLAHRLGISMLRYELEDLSFRYLEPEAYKELAVKINAKLSERHEYVDKIVENVREKLAKENIEASVEGRPKHFFSIYRKMIKQNKTLDQIFDLFAIRAIVKNTHDCYEVLGVAHELYKPVPGRVKDYIAMPKANMYQSLHTTLIGPEGQPFEMQIRTWEMHRVAEYGIAAHWKYKEGVTGDQDEDSAEAKLSWLRQILEWQRELSDNKEYLDALKGDLNVYQDHVYCFTPKGEVFNLATGSTPIDFAYAIHSAVGNKMIGARVNGKIVTFDYQLTNGDQVEIITSQNSKGPSRDWLKLVKTSQAKSKINQWFKKQNKEENIIKGKELLEKEAKKKGLNLPDLLHPKRVSVVLNKYSFVDWDSLCASIGHGGLKETQVINRLYEEYKKELEKTKPKISPEELPQKQVAESYLKTVSKQNSILVKGVSDLSVRFSKCCSPVPGDEIIGYVTRGRGVSIHRTDCVNIINMAELERFRLIEAEWQLPEKGTDGVYYHADIRIICSDTMGLLTEISRIFTDEKVEVKTMNARTEETGSIFNVGIEITGRHQLDKIINRLQKMQGIREVVRITT